MGKVYGCVRVSGTDQHEGSQLITMTERGGRTTASIWISGPARISNGRSIGTL